MQKSLGDFNPQAGTTQTARLHNAYQAVTPARMSNTLLDSHAALPEGGLKSAFGELVKKLAVGKNAFPTNPMSLPHRIS